MKSLIAILILSVMTLSLSGCITAPPKKNPLKTLMIDECAEGRHSGTGFNSRKSYQLIWYECQQIMRANTEFRKIDDQNFRKNPNVAGFDEQEDFDAETWSLITEVMRKKYYPYYLEPEQEVIRTNIMAEQQAKTITEKSLLRAWEPRLLPVSPYLMNYRQLAMAQEVVSDLIYENGGNAFYPKLVGIERIMVDERGKKDPYRH